MRVGTICYATEQGLGYLAKSFFDADVITDVMLFKHPHGDRPTRTDWYPKGTHILYTRPFACEAVERFLDDLECVVFFETPFDWQFVKRCRERSVKTILIPMYEWYPENVPVGCHMDAMIFPSLLDQDYFKAKYPDCKFLPIPADNDFIWSQRTVAKKFLHNAGNIGSRNHKGTLELLKAIPLSKTPFQMTIRCQDARGLKRLIASAPEVEHDARIQFFFGPIARRDLFKDHDVYVAPEKYNGLSLPLQEAFQSGLVVMTTDRYPINTWLPQTPLIPRASTQQVRVMAGHLEIEESIVEPAAIAAALDYWYDKDISGLSVQGRVWGQMHSWKIYKDRYLDELKRLCQK